MNLSRHWGQRAFQERIDQAQNSFLFELSILENQYNLKDPEGKTAFFEKAAEKLLEFDQELERENYIQAVAEKYRISFDSLRRMVNRQAMKGRGEEGAGEGPRGAEAPADTGGWRTYLPEALAHLAD